MRHIQLTRQQWCYENYLTTSQISKLIGITPQRVNQLALAREIKPLRLVGRTKLWDRDDLPKFKRASTGRPLKKS